MGRTSIEWTATIREDGTVEPGHTINPIRARDKATGKVGHWCQKISPGCQHCYASALQARFGTHEFVAGNRDKVAPFLDESKLREVLLRRKPTTYFVCDMTDLFLDDHSDEWIDACFATFSVASWHTFQILTKRDDRLARYMADEEVGLRIGAAAGRLLDGEWIWGAGKRLRPAIEAVIDRAHGFRPRGEDEGYAGEDREGPFLPLPNVWLGVSVEDQPRANERIPHLLNTPAAVRFASYEPALGPVDWSPWVFDRRVAINHLVNGPACLNRDQAEASIPRPVDWVIVGGESGPDARTCDLTWIRSTVRQCREADVPVFVKQDSGPRPGKQGRIPDDLWAIKEFPRRTS